MFRKPKGTDIHVKSRARDQARWLVRDHGDKAEAVLAAKIAASEPGSADRYRYRLTRLELVRYRRALRREQRLRSGLLGELSSLIGLDRRRRRQRRTG